MKDDHAQQLKRLNEEWEQKMTKKEAEH